MYITDHAQQMAMKRYKWDSPMLKKKAKKALKNGTSIKNSKYFKHDKGNNMKEYERKIYVFEDSTLLTIFSKTGPG